MNPAVICEVLRSSQRGNLVQSLHRGHIAVADSQGRLLFSSGDPHFKTFARSVLKPFQLIGGIESGAAEAFSFLDQELAIVAGSHSGSRLHVEVVGRILSKIGLDESALECGVHPPFDPEENRLINEGKRSVSRLHNNCSGKHSGMLAICRHCGWDHKGYISSSHRVQQLVLGKAAEVLELGPYEALYLATDGCGVPTPRVEISALAKGFARLATDGGEFPYARSLLRIRRAMVDYPEMVAGEGRLCTALMRALKGEVVAKAGGEGIYCIGSRERRIGVCVKVEDGSRRAVSPAIIEVMKQIGLLEARQLEELSDFRSPIVRNHRGDAVGEIRACLKLEECVRC